MKTLEYEISHVSYFIRLILPYMKNRLEIVSLMPNIDAKNNFTSGFLLTYKKDGWITESIRLQGSQRKIMDMFNIENFNEVTGKKVDAEFETDKDGKQILMGIAFVDDRPITYGDMAQIRDLLIDIHNHLDIKKPIAKKTEMTSPTTQS